jgi:hypothetical protein
MSWMCSLAGVGWSRALNGRFGARYIRIKHKGYGGNKEEGLLWTYMQARWHRQWGQQVQASIQQYVRTRKRSPGSFVVRAVCVHTRPDGELEYEHLAGGIKVNEKSVFALTSGLQQPTGSGESSCLTAFSVLCELHCGPRPACVLKTSGMLGVA